MEIKIGDRVYIKVEQLADLGQPELVHWLVRHGQTEALFEVLGERRWERNGGGRVLELRFDAPATDAEEQGQLVQFWANEVNVAGVYREGAEVAVVVKMSCTVWVGAEEWRRAGEPDAAENRNEIVARLVAEEIVADGYGVNAAPLIDSWEEDEGEHAQA